MMSHRSDVMDHIILAGYIALFGITSFLLLLSFRKLREGASGYQRAKNILEDVIYSFSRDLKEQEEKLQEIIGNYEKDFAENSKKIDEINAIINATRTMLEDLLKWKEKFLERYTVLEERVNELASKYDEILNKVNEINGKIDLYKEEKVERKRKTETRYSPGISVGEEDLIRSLNETELKVLEILATEGEKTVPEIRDRIKLTREHTARLMKSLYVRGYVERRTDRIPYVYRLNKSIEELLKRKV